MIAEIILLAVTAAHPQTDLVAAAAASGRPAECMPKQDKASNVWATAQVPNLPRYCFLLARAHARLQHDASGAEKLAREADKALPGRAAPHVVIARAKLKRFDHKLALASFNTALERDPRAVEQPLAMMDLARAQVRQGLLEKALATYRVLVPRASLLPSRTMRARVLLEAAHVSMAVSNSVSEALAYLREAARDQHHALRTDVALSLVLALDRAGRRAQADAVLTEQRSLRSWLKGGEQPSYLVDRHERAVLRGLALERSDPATARVRYQAYLDKAKPGPYADAVRARMVRLP